MKKMKNVLLTMIVIALLGSSCYVCAGMIGNATDSNTQSNANLKVNKEDIPFKSERFDGMIDISTKYSVTIDGEKNYFLPTFDDMEEAIALVTKKASNVLDVLGEVYGLEEITVDNWQQYCDVLYAYLDEDGKPEWYEEGEDEFEWADACFNFMENEDINKELLEYLNSINGEMTAKDKLECAMMLPYTAPLVSQVDEIKAEIMQEESNGTGEMLGEE